VNQTEGAVLSKSIDLNAKEIKRLATKLADLVGMFRSGKPVTDFNWWMSHQSTVSIFNQKDGLPEGQPILDEVVRGIVQLNPNMLSESETRTLLVFDFLQAHTIDLPGSQHLEGQALIDKTRDQLSELVKIESWQDIDIPISNLQLEGDPAKLGSVTFLSIAEKEFEKWFGSAPLAEKIPKFEVVARVHAPGDRDRAREYARAHVSQAIEILRAFCFPFGDSSESWQIGIVGEIISNALTPIRMNGQHSFLICAQAQPELKKQILNQLEPRQWNLIEQLVQKTKRSTMENKLMLGIHWLGEATKPDTKVSRFIKICTALEALVGGEPEAKDLKARGITAMLAERAAFLAGKDYGSRIRIDKDIRKYYGKRSSVIHGEEATVSPKDIDGFGLLVRNLAIALLEMPSELSGELRDTQKLEAWTKKLKYTLHTDSHEED
jgi:hypothetical protein